MRKKIVVAILGATLGVVLMTAGPAAAVPACWMIDWGDCDAECFLIGEDCASVWMGSCSGNSRPYSYTCTDGTVIIDDYCTTTCDNGGGGGGGCFLPGTQITMADGTTKAIENIQAGDRVLAYDEATGLMKADQVVGVHDPVVVDHYLVINGALRVTPVHRMLSAGRWVAIGQLGVGDALTAMDGSVVPISSIERVDAPVAVHNFAVNPYGTYVANGIIVHNRKLPTAPQEPDIP